MITIRSAKKGEIAALQALNDEVFIDNQQYDDDLDMQWVTSENGKKYFAHLLSNDRSCCLIAEDGDKKVGYIAAGPKDFGYRKSSYLEIENMGIIPEYRSQGIGTMLIDACLTWAKENGYQKAYVNSYFDNTKAIDFYKRNGFLEIDVSLEKKIR